MTQKLLFGFVLGFVGYCAYKKLKRTQTTQLPASMNTSQSSYDVSTLAGRRYGR